MEHKKPLNKALFEAWSVNLSNLNNSQLELLKDRKKQLNDKFITLMEEDEEFMNSISLGTDSIKKVIIALLQ
jgi:hypothetical protein